MSVSNASRHAEFKSHQLPHQPHHVINSSYGNAFEPFSTSYPQTPIAETEIEFWLFRRRCGNA